MKATKEKKKLLRAECVRPPVEIRDKTKERRAWLQEKLAEINAKPNRLAKIVGKGSYEDISVYEVTQVEGRLRHRGHCQYCGNSQVVTERMAADKATLVLHGYKRPGTGYIFNECPGMGYEPLETRQTTTEAWLAEARVALETANAVLKIATKRQEEANEKVYGDADGVDSDMRTEALRSKPKLGTAFRTATREERASYESSMRVWRASHPRMAKLHDANELLRSAEQSLWAAKSLVQHFETLLGYKYLGKPLREEVVT